MNLTDLAQATTWIRNSYKGRDFSEELESLIEVLKARYSKERISKDPRIVEPAGSWVTNIDLVSQINITLKPPCRRPEPAAIHVEYDHTGDYIPPQPPDTSRIGDWRDLLEAYGFEESFSCKGTQKWFFEMPEDQAKATNHPLYWHALLTRKVLELRIVPSSDETFKSITEHKEFSTYVVMLASQTPEAKPDIDTLAQLTVLAGLKINGPFTRAEFVRSQGEEFIQKTTVQWYNNNKARVFERSYTTQDESQTTLKEKEYRYTQSKGPRYS